MPTQRPQFTIDGLLQNSPGTYTAVARMLDIGDPVSLGWTDNAGTHLDVLLVFRPIQVGQRARMDDGPKLFVSVGRFGAFGFSTERVYPLHPDYVAEKLGMRFSPTSEALTELVNGVLRELST